jgi:hypothetical protein
MHLENVVKRQKINRHKVLCGVYESYEGLFKVKVFWVVTPCSVVVRYQRFGGLCCLHLQGEVDDMEESGIEDFDLRHHPP